MFLLMFIIINKCQFFRFMQEFFDEEIKMKFLFIKLFISLNNPNKLFTISEVKAVVKSWKEDVAERFLYQAIFQETELNALAFSILNYVSVISTLCLSIITGYRYLSHTCFFFEGKNIFPVHEPEQIKHTQILSTCLARKNENS